MALLRKKLPSDSSRYTPISNHMRLLNNSRLVPQLLYHLLDLEYQQKNNGLRRFGKTLLNQENTSILKRKYSNAQMKTMFKLLSGNGLLMHTQEKSRWPQLKETSTFADMEQMQIHLQHAQKDFAGTLNAQNA